MIDDMTVRKGAACQVEEVTALSRKEVSKSPVI